MICLPPGPTLSVVQVACAMSGHPFALAPAIVSAARRAVLERVCSARVIVTLHGPATSTATTDFDDGRATAGAEVVTMDPARVEAMLEENGTSAPASVAPSPSLFEHYLVFTSGTATGEPRCVLGTARALGEYCR
jgi:acyl-coenzyme A synthetase/AMP-(fatty) acid ligase